MIKKLTLLICLCPTIIFCGPKKDIELRVKENLVLCENPYRSTTQKACLAAQREALLEVIELLEYYGIE